MVDTDSLYGISALFLGSNVLRFPGLNNFRIYEKDDSYMQYWEIVCLANIFCIRRYSRPQEFVHTEVRILEAVYGIVLHVT